MLRARLLSLAQAVGGAVALLLLLRWSPEAPSVLPAAYFFVALALLGMFDVWLPRGDSSELGGAVALAAGLILHPIAAVSVLVAARLLVWLLRRAIDSPWRVFDDASRRILVVGWAAILYRLMDGGSQVAAADPSFYLRVLAVACAFFAMDICVAQVGSAVRLSAPILPLIAGNIRLQGWMTAAQVSVAVLAVMIYRSMDLLGLAIVVGLLLVMRKSFSMLVEVRQAYRSTIEVLARAIEAQDPLRRGHAERVASLAGETGRTLGLHGRRLESLTYAALFHDVGRLGFEDGSEVDQARSADVLEGVTFLSGAVPILQIIDSHGAVQSSPDMDDLVAAYVVERMSEFDDAVQLGAALETPQLSEAIGTRLYAGTRRDVDRALRRVESRARSGRLVLNRAELEEAW
ncbi:MAG: hypothetical protein Q7W16_01570 [Coriobacteriia bacterium]|nr:hypothetical protein [Coriobacteriia bacterium]